MQARELGWTEVYVQIKISDLERLRGLCQYI
jgi:hypothetical protein